MTQPTAQSNMQKATQDMVAPKGYGIVSSTDGLGKELWRMLICEKCGSTIQDDVRFVQIHDRFHSELTKELQRLQSAYAVQSYVVEELP